MSEYQQELLGRLRGELYLAHAGAPPPENEMRELHHNLRREMLALHLLQELGVEVVPAGRQSTEEAAIALGHLAAGDIDLILRAQDEQAGLLQTGSNQIE
jgi:hypothetical protein